MTSQKGSVDRRLSDRKGTAPSSTSVVTIQAGGSKPPLFVLAPGAMTVMGTARLAHSLDSEQPLYALQPSGMGGPVPADYRIEEIAAAYVRDVQVVRPEGPYLLGGMCTGGILALEMAQQLVAQGEKVELLVIVDTALTDPRSEPGFVSFASPVMNSSSPRQRIMRNIQIQINKIRRRRRDRAFERSERGRDIVRIHKMNMKARLSYRAQVFPGKILLFLSEDFANHGDLASEWSQIATEGMEHHVIPGSSHRSMWKPPHIDMWSEKLNAALEKAQE